MGLMHEGVLQCIFFDALSDVTVVLGMRQSIDKVGVLLCTNEHEAARDKRDALGIEPMSSSFVRDSSVPITRYNGQCYKLRTKEIQWIT